MLWWGQCWQNQQKLQEHYYDHKFLSMLKSMRMLLALNVTEYIIYEKLLSFKNSIEDKAKWVVQTVACDDWWHYDCNSYPTNWRCFIHYWQQSEDFFYSYIQIFSLNISEVKQKVLVMQLHEHLHQDQWLVYRCWKDQTFDLKLL